MWVRLALLGIVGLATTMWFRRRGPGDQRAEFADDRALVERGLAGDVERRLREELVACESGFRPAERWSLVRTRLAQLLIGAGDLEQAAAVLARPEPDVNAELAALARVPGHELAVLTDAPAATRLVEIERDRIACLEQLSPSMRRAGERAWGALEGLCRIRMGDDAAGIGLIEQGLYTLENNLARTAYLLHLGHAYAAVDRQHRAVSTLSAAASAFPGSRWAEEAAAERDRLRHT